MPAFLIPLLLQVATNPSVDASVASLLTGLFNHMANSDKVDAPTKALIADVSTVIPDMVKAVVSNTIASVNHPANTPEVTEAPPGAVG